MRIAQVYYKYYPYVGGVEAVVKEISERLARKAFYVEVLSQDPEGKYPSEEMINDVKVRRFKTGPLGIDLRSCGTLRQYLKEKGSQYDIIHAHSYHAFPALYAAWGKGKSRFIFQPHYHGRGHTLLMSLLHKPYKFVGRGIFDKADKVICVSEAEKCLVEKDFPNSKGKVAVIPNGVDIESISEATPFSYEERCLLYVGRLEKYKNVHLIINTMPYLTEEYKLIIIGDGTYKSKLFQSINRLHLVDRVKILSGLPDEEVYRWYKTCNLVLNLSCQEAFGITILEALAAGKPAIVNNRAALAEFAAKFDQVHTLQAEALSPEQLAEQIALRCNGEASTPDLSEYSWESITSKVISVYKEAIS